MEYVFLLLGIIIIVVGAEIFIDGIESTAINFKIPRMFIAFTVVAFGTSAPELVISFQGLLNNHGDIVLSNIIGSTIVNILLVIGIASLIKPIKVKNNTVKKELPLHLSIIFIFACLYLNSFFGINKENFITRMDALVLLLIFSWFLKYLISLIKNRQNNLDTLKEETLKHGMKKSIIYSILGLGLIIVGSNLAVDNSILVAYSLGWSEKLTTMLFLVIGTSIPELIISIISARRGQFDYIVGNIIGTNIFNICIVLGLPILILGDVNSKSFSIIDMIVVVLSGSILYFFARNDKVISRKEGTIMLLIFIFYYTYIFL